MNKTILYQIFDTLFRLFSFPAEVLGRMTAAVVLIALMSSSLFIEFPDFLGYLILLWGTWPVINFAHRQIMSIHYSNLRRKP